jgi:hypothetical protein
MNDLFDTLLCCTECEEPLSEEEVSVYSLQWQWSGDMYCSEHRDCPDDCRHTPCRQAGTSDDEDI